MSVFQIDKDRLVTKLRISLVTPNMKTIGIINEAKNRTGEFNFGTFNELSFTIPKYFQRSHIKTRSKNYDNIKDRYLIKIEYGSISELMVVTRIKKSGGIDAQKSITAKSLQYELHDKRIRSYEVESINPKKAMTDALQYTTWTVGYIDPTLNELYRAFDETGTTSLQLLTKIAETYEGILQFDTFKKTVSLYRQASLEKDMGFTASYRKYIKTLSHDSDPESMVTRLYIYGKDDLSINSVNPAGTSYIEDFSYFMQGFETDSKGNVISSSPYMSDELCKAIINYNKLIDSKSEIFKNHLKQLQPLREESADLLSDMYDLETELEIIEDRIFVAQTTKSDASSYLKQKQEKLSQIQGQQNKIDRVEGQISKIQSDVDTLRKDIALENHFSKELLIERDFYIIEDEWIDRNYFDPDELYEAGKKVLQKSKEPKQVLEFSLVQFLEIVEAQRDWNRVGLGYVIRVNYDPLDILSKSIIISMKIDFDGKNLDFTVADVKYKNSKKEFAELLYKSALSTSQRVDMSGIKWNDSVKKANQATEILNGVWDASKRRIVAGVNESVEISNVGIRITNPTYPDDILAANSGVLALSRNGGQDWQTAISASNGIVAELIAGKMILGENLHIENDSGILRFDHEGLTVTRQDGLIKTYVNATDGIKIQRRLNNTDRYQDVFYADVDGILYARGLVIDNTSTLGGYTVDEIMEQAGQNISDDRIENKIPSKVSNLIATGLFETIQLEWEYNGTISISHYEVHASKQANFLPDKSTLVWAGKTGGYAFKAKRGETWYFRVRAVNTHNVAGSYSDQAYASTAKIISDDILFGEEIAEELRELSKTAQLLADGTVDFNTISDQAKEALQLEARKYTDAEIKATEEALLSDLNNRIGDVNLAIDGLNEISTNLKDRVDGFDTVIDDQISKVNSIEGSIGKMQSDLATKVDGNWVDGRLQTKAESEDVYIKTEIDDKFTKVISVTQYSTDKQGFITRFELNESRISQTELDITSMVRKTEFDDVEGRLTEAETKVNQNAEEISNRATKTEVNTISGTVSDLSSAVIQQAGLIEQKVSKTDYTKDINGINGKIESHSTLISQNAESIKSKAEQTVVNTIKGTVDSHTSTLTQHAKEISAKLDNTIYQRDKSGILSSIEANTSELELLATGLELRVTKEEFDTLGFSGRNLLRNSTFNEGMEGWSSALNDTYQILNPETDKPNSNIFMINPASTTSQKVSDAFFVEIGETYTVSFDIKIEQLKNSTGVLFALRSFSSKNAGTSESDAVWSQYLTRFNNITVANKWARLSYTFVPEAGNWLRVIPYNADGAGGIKSYYREIMVEKSNKASVDWSPAPEDAETGITAVRDRVSKTETTLTAHAGQISAKAEKSEVYTRSQIDTSLGKKVDTTTYTSKISELTTSINGISGRVSSSETNINSLTGEMSSAKSQIASLDVKANGIITSVSEIRADFEDLDISGRNLIRNSKGDTLTGWSRWSDTVTQIFNFNGSDWIRVNRGDNNVVGIHTPVFNMKANITYTISFTFRSYSNSGYNLDYIYLRQYQSGTVSVKKLPNVNMSPSSGFKGDISTDGMRVWFTFSHTEDVEEARLLLAISDRASGAGFIIKEIQVEEGNRPTAWNPPIEEVDGRITSAESSITTLATEVSLKASQTSVNSLTQRMTTAEGTLKVLPGQISAKVDRDGLISEINLHPGTIKIETRLLEITDFANIVDNGDFENDTTGKVPNGWTPTSNTDAKAFDMGSWNNPNGSNKCIGVEAKSGGNGDIIQSRKIQVSEGDEFYIEFDYRTHNNAGTGNISVGFRTYAPDGTALGWVTGPGSTTKGATWRKITGTYKVTAGIGYIAPRLRFGDNGETTNRAYYDNIIIRRKNNATMIVDGSVMANHMAANSITAGNGAIANAAITRLNLQNGIVGTLQVEDGAITRAKIGRLAVDEARIANGAITNAKIANATIESAKIKSIDAGKVTTGTLKAITVSGVDITGSTISGTTIWVDGDKPDFLYSNAIDTNPNSQGVHIYLRPTPDGEVRATVTRTTDQYVPIRASGIKADYIETNSAGNGVHLYARPTGSGELRVTARGGTTAYRPVKALSFIGDVLEIHPETASNNLYLRPRAGSEVRATSAGTITNYVPIRANQFIAESIDSFVGTGNTRVIATNGTATLRSDTGIVYLQTPSEVRVVAPLTTGVYKPILASDFIPSSSEKWKTNITRYEDSALDLLRQSVIYRYIKHDAIDFEYGFITEKETPQEIIRGEGVSSYSLQGISVKAIQELDIKMYGVEDRIATLELENQYLKQKIKHLESLIN